jgi:drug/metabolite transporter (DMT)-like permease
LRTASLTTLALVAFAANSLLCRLALRGGEIDAASYTSLRLLAGAAALWGIIAWVDRPSELAHGGSWAAAAMLFLYAIAFSFAYLTLDAGTGALVLFGAVQTTMIAAGLKGGERPHALEWLGLVTAFGGLVYLVFPGLSAPEPLGAGVMAIAGIAWGVYSLRGRTSRDPLGATAANFGRAVPFALIVSLVLLADADISARGASLAVASGALASGLGYVIWYAALRGLSTSHAGIVQLTVPVLAAIGGVLFLAETVTLRLLVSTITILGGVFVSLWSRDRPSAATR